MKFSQFTKNIRSQLLDELKVRERSNSSVGSVEMAISEIPRIVEKRGYDWVLWGEDNMYPWRISDLKYGSPIHNAIVSTAADMIAGDGFLINGAKTKEESESAYNSLPQEVKLAYDLFIDNPHSDLTISEVLNEIALDFKEQGGFCYEVVFNNDFTKIANVKYVDIRNVRAGKMENGKVTSYFYTRDWSKATHRDNKPVEIPAVNFKDPRSTGSLNQMVYVKRGKLEYYPEPDYIGALTWIQTDKQMGIFHLSNIENGMNPSMKLQFYKVPTSEAEKQSTLDDIRRAFVGAKKTGKHMVFFSDGKETAPDISPVQTNNLDKQLLLLAELCAKEILTGHKLTSPTLAGVTIPGQLGGNADLEKNFQTYDISRIKPYRNRIAGSFQKILDFNKIPIKWEINPFNPFV